MVLLRLMSLVLYSWQVSQLVRQGLVQRSNDFFIDVVDVSIVRTNFVAFAFTFALVDALHYLAAAPAFVVVVEFRSKILSILVPISVLRFFESSCYPCFMC